MLSPRKKLVAWSTALLAAMTVGCVAIAGAAPDSESATPVGASAMDRTILGAQTTAVDRVSPEIERTLSLFRTRTATPVPPNLVPMVASPSRYGRNAALARQIQTVTGTGYVIPGDGYVCIVVPDPIDGYGSTCATVASVKTRGLYIGLKEGAIPEGKHAQTVVVPDGATAEVPGASGEATRSAGTTGVVSGLVDIGDDITVDAP